MVKPPADPFACHRAERRLVMIKIPGKARALAAMRDRGFHT
jgi:hypothetical protein